MRKSLAAALVVLTTGLAAAQGLHAAPADSQAAGTGPDFARCAKCVKPTRPVTSPTSRSG